MRFPNLLFAALLTSGPVVAAGSSAPAISQADLAALAGRGRTAMAAGRFDEAAELYARVVQALPDEPGMRLNLGMALSMAGQPAEALEHLEAAVRLQPGLVPASLFLGMAHMDLGQPARAIGPLETFLAAQPDDLDAGRMLADAFVLTGRFEDAVRQLRGVTEQAARDPRAWYALGRAYEGLATEAYEALQRTAPGSFRTTLRVAETMLASGRDANAFRLFREVLEERPDQPGVHEALALIYERRGHPDWARVERDRAAKVPPRDCGPGAEDLECGFRAGSYDAVLAATRSPTAEALYWRSRAADAGASEAFARLGALPPSAEAILIDVERRRDRREPPGEAIDELKRALAGWPDDPRLRLELIRTLFATGETEEIRPLLDAQLQREPGSTELALTYAETWLRLLQPKRAIPYLEKVLAVDPKLTAAQVALGRAYMEVGETERAIAPLEAALDSDTDGTVHYRLSRAYRETGKPELARQTRERFEEIKQAASDQARSRQEEFQITPPPGAPSGR
jgi:predicted Zn-dependent protease